MHIYIKPVDQTLMGTAQECFDNLIKPKNSLGKLEPMVTRYEAIRGVTKRSDLDCEKMGVFIFASPESMELAGQLMADKSFHVNVVLGDKPSEIMEEAAMLVQEFISKENYQLVAFEVLDKNKNSLTAVAGGMLQAAAMGVGIMHNGFATERGLKLAVEREPEVADYVLGQDDIMQFKVEKPGQRALMNFSLFMAGLKCYREMATFQEAGIQHV